MLFRSLPDLDNLVSDSKGPVEDVINDSLFAVEGKTENVKPVADVAVGNDSTLMAEAIRTLLKREG